MFRKLALRLIAERCPDRVGSNLFGDSFRCLIASVHVEMPCLVSLPARLSAHKHPCTCLLAVVDAMSTFGLHR